MADDVFRSGDEQRFGLADEVVVHSEVDQLDARRVIGGEGAAARWSRHGRVERAVVAVADLNLFAILASEREVGFLAEEDDLFVVPVLDENGHALWRVVGKEVDCALNGIEIAAAVGRNDDAGVHWRAEDRALVVKRQPSSVVKPVKRSGKLKHAGIDLHDVLVAVSQDLIVGINRRHVAMEDDRIEMKVGETADGGELVVVQVGGGVLTAGVVVVGEGESWTNAVLGGMAPGRRVGPGRDAEIEGVHQVMAGRIVDPNLARFPERGSASERSGPDACRD